MKRGDVWLVRLDPIEGSEQGGVRPAVISNNTINQHSSVIIAAPFTRLRVGQVIYSTQLLVMPPQGGLSARSVLLGEQPRAVSVRRFLSRWGEITPDLMQLIDIRLRVAMML